MQTFLPYPDFEATARVLDWRRLGKQRVECMQILNALHGTSKGWVNHPAVRMWRGYEDALETYQSFMIEEWVRRGEKMRHTITLKTETMWLARDKTGKKLTGIFSEKPTLIDNFGETIYQAQDAESIFELRLPLSGTCGLRPGQCKQVKVTIEEVE
jgi:hypothetical protein